MKVLNTHISDEEMRWLAEEAERTEQTKTAVVRDLIRSEMRRRREVGERAWPVRESSAKTSRSPSES